MRVSIPGFRRQKEQMYRIQRPVRTMVLASVSFHLQTIAIDLQYLYSLNYTDTLISTDKSVSADTLFSADTSISTDKSFSADTLYTMSIFLIAREK